MSYTYQTSTSRSKSYSTGAATETASGEATTTGSTTFISTVETSSHDGSSGLAGVIGGDAYAVGEDTFTFGSITAEMDSHGMLSELDATITVVAAAQSSGDEAVYVSADSFTDTSAGTEVKFTTTKNTTSTTQDSTGTQATASSTTSVSAFNIEPSRDSTGSSGSTDPDSSDWDFDTGGTADLDGNLALVVFHAEAFGAETYIAADGVALAIKDELSLSSVYLEIAVA